MSFTADKPVAATDKLTTARGRGPRKVAVGGYAKRPSARARPQKRRRDPGPVRRIPTLLIDGPGPPIEEKHHHGFQVDDRVLIVNVTDDYSAHGASGSAFLRKAFQLCCILGLVSIAGLLWTRWVGVAALFLTFALFAVLNGAAYQFGEEPMIGPRSAPLIALASLGIALAMVVAGLTS